MPVGSFAGKSLILVGAVIVLLSVLPLSALNGFIILALGAILLYGEYRDRINKSGLRSMLPDSLNNFLTRTDFLEYLVLKIRENSVISKVSRLMIVKWFELSRREIVDVLEGVWPKFRDLSDDTTLLDLTPRWFKGMYDPLVQSDCTEEPVGDDWSDQSTILAPSPPHRRVQPNVAPLILWLTENRIRKGMSDHLPAVRRTLVRGGIPLIALFILWRKVPSLRRPMKGAGLIMTILYLVSISRGLPSFSERIFKVLNFSYYKRRGERPFLTDKSSGSLAAVVYAVIEPFVPIVNVANVLPKNNVARSPALSQASTLDHTVLT